MCRPSGVLTQKPLRYFILQIPVLSYLQTCLAGQAGRNEGWLIGMPQETNYA
ncbi:MAG: hypothetical protein RIC80_12460 [Cyclobacteriaceae bacterium]